MVLFYHKTGGNSLKFVGFGKKNGGYNMNMAKLCVDVVFCKFYNMESLLVSGYVVALMADNINGLLRAVDVVKASLERGKTMTSTGKFNRVQHQSLANHDSCCIPRKMEERCNIKEAVYGFHVVFFAEKTACFVLCRKKSLIPLAFSRISGIIYRRVILHAILAMDRSIAI